MENNFDQLKKSYFELRADLINANLSINFMTGWIIEAIENKKIDNCEVIEHQGCSNVPTKIDTLLDLSTKIKEKTRKISILIKEFENKNFNL